MIGLWFNDSLPGKADFTDFQLGLAFAASLALLIYCWRDAEREARRMVATLTEFETEETSTRRAPRGTEP